jgi:hypothetical protein
MHWLAVACRVWHNRRHERAGHLFQGRFESFVVGEETYLERLVLYMHRNPLRAGVAERLAEYPWSSYRALANARGHGARHLRRNTGFRRAASNDK